MSPKNLKEQFDNIKKAILLANKSGVMDEELIDKMILSLGYYYANLYKGNYLVYSDETVSPDVDFIESVNERVSSLLNQDKGNNQVK